MFDNLTTASLISNAIVLLLAVVIHEYAHARVAYEMGDPTAKEQNRMTLDPRANVWWPGYIIGVLIGFAILGSAPVSPWRMRNSRWGMFWAVLAGPVSNLVLAFLFALPFMFGILTPTFTHPNVWVPTLNSLMTDMVFLNVLLFIFNLLPLAPLDGWTVTLSALPPGPADWWAKHRQTSTYALWGLIGLSFFVPQLPILSILIGQPTFAIVRLLMQPYFAPLLG